MKCARESIGGRSWKLTDPIAGRMWEDFHASHPPQEAHVHTHVWTSVRTLSPAHGRFIKTLCAACYAVRESERVSRSACWNTEAWWTFEGFEMTPQIYRINSNAVGNLWDDVKRKSAFFLWIKGWMNFWVDDEEVKCDGFLSLSHTHLIHGDETHGKADRSHLNRILWKAESD